VLSPYHIHAEYEADAKTSKARPLIDHSTAAVSDANKTGCCKLLRGLFLDMLKHSYAILNDGKYLSIRRAYRSS
jgi:hypothetical protein